MLWISLLRAAKTKLSLTSWLQREETHRLHCYGEEKFKAKVLAEPCFLKCSGKNTALALPPFLSLLAICVLKVQMSHPSLSHYHHMLFFSNSSSIHQMRKPVTLMNLNLVSTIHISSINDLCFWWTSSLFELKLSLYHYLICLHLWQY